MFADDLGEFMDAFAQRFGVDLSAFLRYFHTGEEGMNLGGVFFAPPHDRVTRIPITLRMLREAAELGNWPVVYPQHSLPARRYDILINQVIAGGMVLWSLARSLS